jgi:methylase of polypeptide subunit release factors
MPLTIQKLEEKWERNKDVYAEKEIGNRVQEFVADVFESEAVLSLKFGTPSLQVDSFRELFFDDITSLIQNFKSKLNIEEYFKGVKESEKKRKATEITYAYIIQFILYKTLVDNDFARFGNEFAERVETIKNGVQHNSFKEALGAIQGISKLISENVYRPFIQEQHQIDYTLQNLLCQAKNTLSDVSPWLDIFIFIKKYNFGNIRNEIFGYIYENYLKELYSEENKGQYFTDPAVAKFMLEQIGYAPTDIKDRTRSDKGLSIIDPSCGSGTFLYSAVDNLSDAFGYKSEKAARLLKKAISENIFGLDISEFPLYLAEMNILMRMLPLIMSEKYNTPMDKKIKVFLTKDSISEFLDTNIKSTLNDSDVEYRKNSDQLALFQNAVELNYQSFVREKSDLEEMKQSLEHHKHLRRRFDFVIGNPPYIGYNECSKQDLLIVKLIREKKVLMSDIYGVNLNTVPGKLKAYSPKPNLYAFFIALGIALLKDKGKLCYIIPQTLLTASDLDVLRYHLAKYTMIDTIIIFSSEMFIGRGIRGNKPVPTSSLIFVASRQLPKPDHKIKIAHHISQSKNIEECLSDISEKNKNVRQNLILQTELLKNFENWSFIKHNQEISELFKKYNKNDTVDIYRIPEISESEFNSLFYFDKGLVFPKDKICSESDIENSEDYFYLTKADKHKYQLELTDNIISKNDIRLPKGAQGFDVYERKYKIIWRYMNPERFYFTDKKVMINFNWVIISGDNQNEMLYILSLLNSNVSRFVFLNLLKSDHEKDMLIGIKTIKDFIRIPKITKKNQHIKDEIIRQTEEFLKSEEVTLSDLVSFSGVMMQKFDAVKVKKDKLLLIKDSMKTECRIKCDSDIVSQTIRERYSGGEAINLPELKALSIVNNEIQKKNQDYIDDLIFALYFDTDISNIGIDYAEEIKAQCGKNRFYDLVHS